VSEQCVVDTHTVECGLCLWSQTWDTVPAAQAAAVWHVANDHPEEWDALIGRAPLDPRPETLGHLVG
jgi:hypothetical protein